MVMDVIWRRNEGSLCRMRPTAVMMAFPSYFQSIVSPVAFGLGYYCLTLFIIFSEYFFTCSIWSGLSVFVSF